MQIVKNPVILVVDDAPELVELLRIVLAVRGYELLGANDGDEALRVARNYDGPIDLLITDVEMPGKMNGVQLAMRLAKERPEIRVVLMSGWVQDPDEIQHTNLPFLRKPFTPTEVYSIIEEALEAPRRPRMISRQDDGLRGRFPTPSAAMTIGKRRPRSVRVMNAPGTPVGSRPPSGSPPFFGDHARAKASLLAPATRVCHGDLRPVWVIQTPSSPARRDPVKDA